MNIMRKTNSRALRRERHKRVRRKISGTASCPRLSVFRSLNHIYAQIIDDSSRETLVSASTLEPVARGKLGQEAKIKRAEFVGSLVAQKAIDKDIRQVVFDRGGYKYHGRVKALGEAARQAGLKI